MKSDIKFHEADLYSFWRKQNFKDVIKTFSGEDISIIDAGFRNDDAAGPDFLNARIRIGNLTFVGDIEIDRDYSDWKTHGHNIDGKYNKVILHTSLFNKHNYGYVYTRNGRKVLSVPLERIFDNDLLSSIQNKVVKDKSTKGRLKCNGMKYDGDNNLKEKFLVELGFERFNRKRRKLFERLKEIQHITDLGSREPAVSYDLSGDFYEKKFKHSDFGKTVWQQLFYEQLFEALGYSKNKVLMTQLAQNVNIDFLSKIEQDGIIIDKYEAALFYVAGLTKTDGAVNDDDSARYLERTNLLWNSMQPFYDGKFIDRNEWHFFKMRPQNFPTLRIAGGARILYELIHNNLMSKISQKIAEIQHLEVLKNSLRTIFIIKSAGYWQRHHMIGHKSAQQVKLFVGLVRADDIVVNVVLPLFTVYFELSGSKNLVRKILKLYSIYEQHSDNNVVQLVGPSLQLSELSNKSLVSQGMIELYKSYCSKNRCLECEIGKRIF